MSFSTRNMTLLVIVTVFFLAVGVVTWTATSRTPEFSGPRDKIVVGTMLAEFSSLIWVAQENGYFAESGLDVIIQDYESGVAAVQDLLLGKVNLATAAEFVFVVNRFERPDDRILAAIDKWDQIRLVAKKDSGIGQPSDLRVKRIGVLMGSQAEFCLAKLLMMSGIAARDVHMVNLGPSEQIAAITNDEIDAAIVWEPFARKLQDALGKTAVTLPAQGGQDLYWTLICKDELVNKQPMVIQHFLSALLKAERFISSNEAEAKAIVARRLGHEMPYLESIWKNSHFTVSLPQPLILTMEDQARWMMSAGLTKKTEVPDFLDSIYLDALKSLAPEAITIIH